MNITPMYAGLIGLMMLILSLRVIILRQRAGVDLGHSENTLLERRIRAQANLAEYAPVALILLTLLEWSEWSPLLLHLLGLLLVIGRTLHAWALSFTLSNSVARVSGTALTLTMICLSACFCLFQFFLTSFGFS